MRARFKRRFSIGMKCHLGGRGGTQYGKTPDIRRDFGTAGTLMYRCFPTELCFGDFMTPVSNTLFSVCLYLALCALNSWTARRARNARLHSDAAPRRPAFLRPSEAV